MTRLYVPVGIPGCGKSTYGEQLLVDGQVDAIISTDAIREELTGDSGDISADGNVFYTFHNRITTYLNFRQNVYADATNLRYVARSRLRDIALKAGAEPFAVRFSESEDFELCQQRNVGRSRVVPEEVMKKFYRVFMDECSVALLQNEHWVVIEK